MPDAAELMAEGRQARTEHRLDEARGLYNQAAQLCLRAKNPLAYAHAIRHMADMFLEEERFSEAQPLYREALELYRGNLETVLLDLANAVRPFALLQEKLANRETAKELWLEARNLYASLRIEAGITECDAHLATLQQS